MVRSNRVSCSHAGKNNSVDRERVRAGHKSLERNQASGALNVGALTGQVEGAVSWNEVLLALLKGSSRDSDLKLDVIDRASSVVGKVPVSSDSTAFESKLKGHVRRYDGHVQHEFLREVTRSTVSADCSELEVINVTSLKVVERVASSFGCVNESRTSIGSRGLDTIRLGSHSLSEPKLEAGVREGVPFEDNLLSYSRLNSRFTESSRSASESHSLSSLVARKTASILVASKSSDSYLSAGSEEEGSTLERSHRDVAGLCATDCLGEIGLSTSLSRQVAEGSVDTLVVLDFKVVSSDLITTVGRSSPGKVDITLGGGSSEAHGRRHSSQVDGNPVGVSSSSTRVDRANLESVSSLSCC